MKRYVPLLVVSLFIVAEVSAATCRSQIAASAGSAAGYSRDETAAKQVEQKESISSDAVGRCVSGITSIVVVPTFPSLSEIFSAAIGRVCAVAIDKIREGLPRPTGVPGIGSGTGVTIVPSWPVLPEPSGYSVSSSLPAKLPAKAAPPSSAPAAASDSWRAIWR